MPVTYAHLSVSSFSQHFVHRLFSIQRLQEHSTAFNSCYRYNACRHAASTSMYAQVRHPWRTWPVHVIPKGRTCAAGFLLPAPSSRLPAPSTQLPAPSTPHPSLYPPLSIQRSQARSKYIHVCSSAPSLAHKACTRYTERPNLRCWLPAPSSQLPAPGSQHPAPGSQLPAPSSQLSAPSSQLPALNFPNNNPSKTESRYLDIFPF